MTAKAKAWKTDGKWMVSISFRWPDKALTPFRDRKVIDARSKKDAERWGAQRESELRAEGQPTAPPPPAPVVSDELCSAWWSRYHELCEKGEVGKKNKGRPQAAVDARRSMFTTWIAPVIGHLAMTAVSPADLRKVVDKLDDAVRLRARFYAGKADRRDSGRKPGISTKTALNIWGEVSSAFKEAQRSKRETLRVLAGRPNPTLEVEGPTAGDDDDRKQEALYPSEVVKLLACETVPLERRRCYAVAIYSGLRLGELRNITAAHVDFEHMLLTVPGTKTAAAKRKVTIDPNLRPLLKVLVKERPEGPLLDIQRADGRGGTADLAREDLATADVRREALTRDDADFMPYNFHGHRHTCITHWAVSGKSELWMLVNAGHTDISMTKHYLAAATSLSATFGQPHPPLPASVLGGATVVNINSKRTA